MNAAIVERFAKPPRYGRVADPVAEAAEVLVQVEGAGLHPIVKALANGTHYGSTGALPFVPGVDGAGRLEDGTRVYFGVSRRFPPLQPPPSVPSRIPRCSCGCWIGWSH